MHDHVAGTRAVRLAVAGWDLVRHAGRLPGDSAQPGAGRIQAVVLRFIARVGGARRVFTVAEAGAFDWHSTYTTVPDQLLRQPYRGGELITGIRNNPGDYRAAWRGQWFELHTRASGSPKGITRIFDEFRLTDTPLGMLAQPRSTAQVQLEPLRVAKQIPGIGYLTIERAGTSRGVVPDFRGHLTRHGELWRQPLGVGAQGRSRSDALPYRPQRQPR